MAWSATARRALDAYGGADRWRFTFSPTSGLLLRHDYAPDIIRPLARASRVVVAHGSHDGVPFPRLMRITPRAVGAVLPGPLLVSVEAHAFELE